MFTTRSKSLAPWVLLLEQKSYLSYINLDYENLGYKMYTTILKNHIQKNVDAKTEQITHIHTFSTIPDVIDASYKLNSNLALITPNFCEPFAD